jgi:ATP-binding cassette, subfamily B, bacterial CvaB/MchF/RaxB
MTGVALELAPAEGFIVKDERARLPLSVFFNQLSGSRHALVQVVLLSVVLQLLVLAAPFYAQLTIDEVIARGDVDLLLVLALGFGLLTLIKAASSATRSSILLMVQNVLHFNLGARLFRHLIRLPTSFFEKRHIGDLLSGFSSLQPIRTLLAEQLMAGVLDGIMAVVTLAMIFVYSPLLATIVLTALHCLCRCSVGALPHHLETHRGNDPGSSSGEFNVHRKCPGDPDPQALQSRERTRSSVA